MVLGISSSFANAQALVPTELVFEILAKEEILETAQRNILVEFSRQLQSDNYSPEDLSALAAAVSQKFQRDLNNLSGLSYNLTELLENGYAQKIGKVHRRDIEDIIEKIEQLKGASKGLYKQKALDDDTPNDEELVRIITHDITALTGWGGLPACHDIWQAIKDNFSEAYARWNAHYRKLEESHRDSDNISDTYGFKTKKKFFEETVGSAQEYVEQRTRYEVEQLEFLKDFTRAQAIFRRLASANSNDF